MANQSPGVLTNERIRDLIVRQATSTTGATVGLFDWGPINTPVLIGDPVDLVSTFGAPTNSNFVDPMCAANYLAYTSALYVSRVANDEFVAGNDNSCRNSAVYIDTSTNVLEASSTVTSAVDNEIIVGNDDQFESVHVSLQDDDVLFIGRFPGELANNLSVQISDANGFESVASGTNGTVSANFFTRNLDSNELSVVVTDTTTGEVLERFIGSSVEGSTTESGTNNFIVDIINRTAVYIRMINNTTFFTEVNAGNMSANINFNLDFGSNGSFETPEAEASARIFAWNEYIDQEQYEVDLLFSSGASTVVQEHLLDNVVSVRQDCVAFISPKREDVVGITDNNTILTNIRAHRDEFNSNSYAFIDSNYKYQFDPFNDTYRWVPLNADMAGLHAQSETTTAAWFAAGGFNRGHIKNVTKLAWQPNKAHRDVLYRNEINPVLNFAGEGAILLGNKTMLTSTSAFSSMNVRRLFNVLKRSIAKMARFQLFEFNDRQTRLAFVQAVEPFLRDIQGRRGITEFRVVADTTNNTSQVINNSEFVGDIYIIPARAIEVIRLNFISVAAGVDFEELINLNGEQ